MKDCSGIDLVVEQIAKLVNAAHKSTKICENLERLNHSFVSENLTRWNSQFNMIISFIE